MRAFAKPRVGVSKCLGFAACRYNGAMISDDFVRRLAAHVTFCPVCPEMEIGLGCPRDPIRVVLAGKELRLMQPATGRDVTEAMRQFADSFLGGLGEVDGFLLKSRSPSCGLKDVKVYGGPGGNRPQKVGRGFFGGAVLDRFPGAAAADEGRLRHFTLREHFLTRLFVLAEFREVRRRGAAADLVGFHAANKGLLMAYHQSEMRVLGRIVANPEKRPWPQVMADYGPHLARALARPPRFTSIINVLMHAVGLVSENLSAGEKAFFLDALQDYRAGKVPLSAATTLIKSWGVRFGESRLLGQSYLAPYPEALMDIADSGKGQSELASEGAGHVRT